MFARTSTIALFAMIPLLAAATAVPRTTTPTTPASQCNTGDLQCCNSTQESSNTNASLTSLLGLLGVVVGSLTGQVGVSCSPLNVIGVGGNSCSAQPVCCSNNSFKGVVAVGCTPVNINL
ncbi:fungal hydrophobin-domain-containing protein [Infundibulicybe gibba]|nr:fungal hydrophobin-domain-containing protein [Infundibulicybe gibba]